MTRAVCASCLVSEHAFAACFPDLASVPGQAVQKYHRLLAEGLAANGAEAVVLSAPPITRQNAAGRRIRLADETVRGVRYTYLPVALLPGLKHLVTLVAAFFRACRLITPDSFVLCDALNVSVSLGARLAAWVRRAPCIGVVTDLPDMMSGAPVSLAQRINRRLLAGYDAYLFLTAQMSERVNKRGRPFLVLEGHVDEAMRDADGAPVPKDAPPVLLYAGMLHERYGILRLAEAFSLTALPATLAIYGAGDALPRLRELAERDARIRLMGTVDNRTVVDAERRATLLINPRPSSAEYTKYSFPSKNMEYMASGTPVLTTRLPGMPAEYAPHVYLFDGETPQEMAKTLCAVMEQGAQALAEKGEAGRAFVLAHKTNVQQARRILAFAGTLMKEGA